MLNKLTISFSIWQSDSLDFQCIISKKLSQSNFQNITLAQNYWKYIFFWIEITRITRIKLPAGEFLASYYPYRAGMRVMDHPTPDPPDIKNTPFVNFYQAN